MLIARATRTDRFGAGQVMDSESVVEARAGTNRPKIWWGCNRKMTERLCLSQGSFFCSILINGIQNNAGQALDGTALPSSSD
ncbi:MAG: hypothetical protein CML06_11570 [Pseudomonadales bacterium]|nr:hypothetical protein [Pseudomonadales bacterium]